MPREDSSIVRGMRVESVNNPYVARIAEHNDRALSYYRHVEGQHYKNVAHGVPRYCVAFSGGGIRSAAFNIGALKALEENGRLQNVDLISSVSGGSYAAAWLYIQRHARSEGPLSSLFDKAHIDYIADRAKLLQVPSFGYLLSAFPARLAGTLFSVAQLLDGSIVYINATWVQSLYEDAIIRVFLTAPSGEKYKLPMADMGKIVRSNHLPIVVFNAALVVPDKGYSMWGPRIFEITPFHMGSDAVGFYPWNAENSPVGWTSISRVVRLSGAAIDVTHEDTLFSQAALQLTEASLGGYMPLQENQSGVYLADAGFIDNLGAYSAVRRLCEEIIVLDAAYDPQYEFCDYRALRAALSSEMDVKLKIDDIDSIVPRTPCTIQKTPPSGDQCCPLQSGFDKRRPVMVGSVGPFPVIDGNEVRLKTLRVLYVKMTLNNEEFDQALQDESAREALKKRYEPSVIGWYAERKKWRRGCDPDFPQLTTMQQNFTPDQFRAYVDLGYALVQNQWDIIKNPPVTFAPSVN